MFKNNVKLQRKIKMANLIAESHVCSVLNNATLGDDATLGAVPFGAGSKDEVTPAQWMEVAAERITHFNNLANRAHRESCINLSDCLQYVRVWKSVIHAMQDGLSFRDIAAHYPPMLDEMNDTYWEAREDLGLVDSDII